MIKDNLRLRFFSPINESAIRSWRVGVVGLNANPTYDTGEFAILVGSDPMGHGLGWRSVST